MKKITFILGLIASTVYHNASAQFSTSGNPTITSDDVGIGLPVALVPNAKLAIASGFSITGGAVQIPGDPPVTPLPCALIGKPGLSILWHPLSGPIMAMQGQQLCSNLIVKPNAFEIYGIQYGLGSGPDMPNYAFQVDNRGRTGIGQAIDPDYGLTINDNSIYKGNRNLFTQNVQIQNKLRINSNVLTSNPNWSSVTFPYTFSVDNGNSRFLSKVQISAPITATNLTAKKPITAAFNNYMLAVEGNIVCQKAIVQTSDWADYVFASDYKLMPLAEVENYIATNNHLPDMPNTETVVAQGQDVGEIQKLQQAKIEELTLYIIKMQKEIDALKLNAKN
jgi:hypothetical protein